MEERRITVGQRADESEDASGHAAIGLASSTGADVIVLADGGAGVPPLRAAADSVVASVTRVCRSATGRRPSTLLGEAMGEAHHDLLILARQSVSAGRIAAACVIAHVQEGVATVARAGSVAVFHVRAGVADTVFPESSMVDGGALPSPLGMAAETPPATEIEVVPLEPGDRIVLATVSLARAVDPLSLARTVWTLEPQVAANRLVESARRVGAVSSAVQVVRRDTPGLAGAMEMLQPVQQRKLGRQQDEQRAFDRRERQRRLATFAVWAAASVALVAAALAWYLGGGGEHARPSAPGSLSSPAASSTQPKVDEGSELARVLAAATDVRAGRMAEDVVGGAAAALDTPNTADAASDVRGGDPDGGRLVEETVAQDPDTIALDEIFSRSREGAARGLRRFIIDRYDKIGGRVFHTLDAYIERHQDRRMAEVLVTLLDRRPPPKTRRWLVETLPSLLSAPSE